MNDWNPETDHVTVTVHCFFGLLDRLRILWHGRATVEAQVFCERHPGSTRSASDAWVEPILPKQPTTAKAPVPPYVH